MKLAQYAETFQLQKKELQKANISAVDREARLIAFGLLILESAFITPLVHTIRNKIYTTLHTEKNYPEDHIKTRKKRNIKVIADFCLKPLVKNFETMIDPTSQEHLSEAAKLIRSGQKVVFAANHLSETDPLIFDTWLRNNGYKDISEKMHVFIGSIVKNDPVKRAFSGALNATFVYAPSHIEKATEQERSKMTRWNIQTLSSIKKRFKEWHQKQQGASIWIHPSSKRARPKVDEKGNFSGGLERIIPENYIENKWLDGFIKNMKSLGITHLCPIAIAGTENINGPESPSSYDDQKYAAYASCFYKIDRPVLLEDIPAEHVRQQVISMIREILETDGVKETIHNERVQRR